MHRLQYSKSIGDDIVHENNVRESTFHIVVIQFLCQTMKLHLHFRFWLFRKCTTMTTYTGKSTFVAKSDIFSF